MRLSIAEMQFCLTFTSADHRFYQNLLKFIFVVFRAIEITPRLLYTTPCLYYYLEFGRQKNMATINDIAERLHISKGTVSKGLNGADDISESLRQRILDTAVELGYTKRGKKTKNRKLCIFIENMAYYMEDDFGFDILLGFKQAAFKEDWGVEVIPITHAFQKQRSYDAFMLSQNFSGAFICGFTTDEPWLAEIQHTKVPTILLDNYLPENPMVGSVGSDSEEGIELAIRHLVSLGHEKIAFLNGTKESMIAQVRQQAYELSMRAHHLPLNPDLFAYDNFVMEVNPAYVKRFLDLGATAILCSSDLIAYGVINECKKAGFSVPEDVSVVGYDDLPTSEIFLPSLTTIRQDRILLGKSSYYILYAMVNNVPLSRNLLRPSLIRRETTAIAKPRVIVRENV